MHKTTLIFFCFLFFSSLLPAQENTVDRLRKVIAADTTTGKTKLQAYIQLTSRLSVMSFNETIKMAERGISYAVTLNDSLSYASLNQSMATAYYFKGDYEKAASLYFLAIGIFERANANNLLAYAYNDVAKLYRHNRDLKRAAAYYEKALAIFNRLKDASGSQMILNESGVVYEYKGNYAEAVKRYQASLAIANSLKDEAGKAWSYHFLAGVSLLQHQYKMAEEYHLQALSIRQQLQDSFGLATSYSHMGILYSSWQNYEKATHYLEQSNLIAEKMGYQELLSDNYAEQSKLANVMGDYKKALDYYTWHTQLKDSLFTTQKTRQIEELSTLYETEKKEQQIITQQTTLRKRNSILAAVILLLLIGIALGYLLYNRIQLKQQAKLQQEVLLQQELSAKAVLEAEEKERSRIAQDLHDGVGQMMSAAKMNLSSFSTIVQLQEQEQSSALSNIIKLVDESCREVRAVSHSMMPLALGKKGLPQAIDELISKVDKSVLAISFHQEGFETRADNHTETILYRVVQECISNTLKHAYATTLDISLLNDKDGISVTLEDNGRGFNASAINSKEGIGLKNIKSRIQFLKGTIDFDSQPGKGTLVAIHIPSKS
jgi:two-component system, NarL family, sensor kinase